MRSLLYMLLATIVIGCSGSDEKTVERQPTIAVYGLDGRPFAWPEQSAYAQQKSDSFIHTAAERLSADSSEDNFIWLGRRLAYAGQFTHAIQVFSRGIETYPASVKLLRHRGHRYITLRLFDSAVADLRKAALLLETTPIPRQTEPDGMPNAANIPLSSTQFNVYYHLGLAYYLQGNFNAALQVYNTCMQWSDNDDVRVATTDWLYMTLRRLQQQQAADSLLAALPLQMHVIENDSYWKRLQFYQGKLPIDSLIAKDTTAAEFDLTLVTQGYGAANWYLYNGDTTRAMQMMRNLIKGTYFSAFGFIAAEVDIYRLTQ